MAAGRSSGVRGAGDGRGRFGELREVRLWPRVVRRASVRPTMAAGGSAGSAGTKMAAGGSAGFGGARRWRRDDARASEEPTMAAERSAGFGEADYGRGMFGAGRCMDRTGGGAMWSMGAFLFFYEQ